MILASRSRCPISVKFRRIMAGTYLHRSHLCHGCIYKDESNKYNDIHPNQSRETSIDNAKGADSTIDVSMEPSPF